MAEKKTLIPLDENTRHGGHFVAKSGLKVEISQDIWVILPNNGKGREMKVGWARSAAISPRDQDLIFMVLIYYARTKAASTAEGVVTNIKPYVAEGIPSLYKIKNVWSGLKTNNKKGLNQFFGTLSKLGYDEYDIYHEYTSSHLDKDKKNTLDLDKGALTDFEFDSVAKQVNQSLREFDWEIDRGLDFYRWRPQKLSATPLPQVRCCDVLYRTQHGRTRHHPNRTIPRSQSARDCSSAGA
ncbi:hypothetical protein AL065_26180 [Pseudomonas amygdali pv. ulmi]|nr:hypothetical protein AL065_26180 [Pseudomonas amygdali pv. ulmi]